MLHVIANRRNWTTRYRGETPDYLAIKRWDVALGASFSDWDVTSAASKVLIGETVRKEPFGHDNPVGQMMQINGQLFEVVGVLAPKGQDTERANRFEEKQTHEESDRIAQSLARIPVVSSTWLAGIHEDSLKRSRATPPRLRRPMLRNGPLLEYA